MRQIGDITSMIIAKGAQTAIAQEIPINATAIMAWCRLFKNGRRDVTNRLYLCYGGDEKCRKRYHSV